MRKILAILAFSFSTPFIAVGPALADDYAGNNPRGSVSAGSIVLGGQVDFTADCFVAGSSVTVSVTGPGPVTVTTGTDSGTNSAVAVADAEGDISATIKPSAAGSYQISASGPRTCSTGEASAGFEVLSAKDTAPSQPDDGTNGTGGGGTGTDGTGSGTNGTGNRGTGSGTLPRTGPAALALQVGLGGGLVAAGAGTIYVLRRRRRATN